MNELEGFSSFILFRDDYLRVRCDAPRCGVELNVNIRRSLSRGRTIVMLVLKITPRMLRSFSSVSSRAAALRIATGVADVNTSMDFSELLFDSRSPQPWIRSRNALQASPW